ncbi:dTDP-4-dehydrorhamnose 3,5-epimerase family protein [Alteribacter aurantiacus]|uniref:dTDP-4-dehydrorhamnose 3,5-epimerase family protein n=1 Tax=Alteribacter aurantiacus TaxID=254410 RepID=UPI000478DF85
MNLIINATKIPGCYEISSPIYSDHRGTLTKTFHNHVFNNHQLTTNFRETYYTISHNNVLRGFHFQTPPASHTKMVSCSYGEIMDVVIDLRKGSPTFGQYHVFTLSPERGNQAYIPDGLAHAYYVSKGPAIVIYHVTSEHSASHDSGIHWQSINFTWPTNTPILSDKDKNLPLLSQFKSPFTF